MQTAKTEGQNRAVVLVFGLITVFLLMLISLLALGSYWWIGVAIGLLEVGVAWRVRPAPGVEIVRYLIALFGVLTVVAAVVRLLVGLT